MAQTRKSYVPFNVGAMMKVRRQFREEVAIDHKSTVEKKMADSVAAKRE